MSLGKGDRSNRIEHAYLKVDPRCRGFLFAGETFVEIDVFIIGNRFGISIVSCQPVGIINTMDLLVLMGRINY